MKTRFPFRRPALPALAILVLALSSAGSHAQAPPSTDIWLLEVSESDTGGATVALSRRVTDRASYDNQPRFLSDGRLAYTAMNDQGSTDILVYDLSAGTTTALIETPQSDYSATPVPGTVPGREAVSIIRDYGNQVQQLWSIPIGSAAADGSVGKNLLPDINPLGYHAWVNAETLLVFVLGEPPTLRLAKVGPGEGRVLTSNPGRTLALIPGSDKLTFVHKLDDNNWWLTVVDPVSGDLRRLFRTLPEREDYAWSPSGWLYMANDSKLYRHRASGIEWSPVADLAEHGIRGVSRMAFDGSGAWLAVVAERAD